MQTGTNILASATTVWKKAFATNATTTGGFTALNETATEPTGAGVINISDSHNLGRVPTHVRVLPYGTDAANEAFSLRIVGWSKTGDGDNVWVPTELLTLTVTLGAAQRAGATNFFADTLAAASGLTGDAKIVSLADDTRAWALVDMMGAQKLQFQVNRTTAATCNTLYSWL